MSSGTPSWLAELQAQFTAMLRTPLDRSSGTLSVSPSKYPRELAGSDRHRLERLAVYNRQYWFRLFGVLGGAFPLTARLVGHWRFNGHASRFLEAHPPRSYFIDHVSNGFADFLAATARESDVAGLELTLEAWREAIRIDEAWRMAHYAVLPPVWRLTPEEAPRVFSSRLRTSPTVHLVDEGWPLVDLRGRVVEEVDGEGPIALPPAFERGERRSWAIVRRPQGVGALALEPLEAQLFRLLGEHRVDEALARLEACASPNDREALPNRARFWLMRSVELGFWSGLQ